MIEKKRNTGLTVWLVLMLFFNALIALTYLANNQSMYNSFPDINRYVWYIYGFLGLMNAVFTIYILKWKIWAFYAFCASVVIAFLLNITVGLGLMNAVLGLLGPIILYVFMRPQWELFE